MNEDNVKVNKNMNKMSRRTNMGKRAEMLK